MKKLYLIVIPLIALGLLLGVMVTVVHVGENILSASHQYRINIEKWIHWKNHAVDGLEKYLENQDAESYRKFRQHHRKMQRVVEASDPIFDRRYEVDSVADGLMKSYQIDRHRAEDMVYYARLLHEYPQVKNVIQSWRKLSRQVTLLEDLSRRVEEHLNDRSLNVNERAMLHKQIARFDSISTLHEAAMVEGLKETTFWLEDMIKNLSWWLALVLFISGGGIVTFVFRRMDHQQEKYQQLFSNAKMAILYMDRRGRVLELNDAFTELFGYEKQEIKHRNLDDLLAPKEKLAEARNISQKTLSGESLTRRTWRVDREGNRKDLIIASIPVYTSRVLNGFFALYYDISELVHTKNKLQKSLHENQLLIQEVHHRVKNNLAVIAGLLHLQIDISPDEETRTILRDSQSRIYSMATIHEMLYHNDTFTSIRFEKYLKKQIEHLRNSQLDNLADITLSYSYDALELNINQAIPCGLIINELVSNAIEHAFMPDQSGEVHVSIHNRDKNVTLTVRDNGMGFIDYSNTRDESIGLNIVHSLVEQLEGDIDFGECKNGYGSEVEVTFQKEDVKGSVSGIRGSCEI